MRAQDMMSSCWLLLTMVLLGPMVLFRTMVLSAMVELESLLEPMVDVKIGQCTIAVLQFSCMGS